MPLLSYLARSILLLVYVVATNIFISHENIRFDVDMILPA